MAAQDTTAVAAVLMAAGEGKRMGGLPKPLITRDGEPLVLRQIRLLTEAGIDRVVVVLGYYADRVSMALEKARWAARPGAIARAHVKAVINPAPEENPASSLRCGLKALRGNASATLVLLADQPLLEAADIATVLSAWHERAEGIQLVMPEHGDELGHPVIFDHAVRDAVMAGSGVRKWRAQHLQATCMLSVDHPRFTADLDTPADLERFVGQGVDLKLPESR